MPDNDRPPLDEEDLAVLEELTQEAAKRDAIPMSARRMVDTPEKYNFPIGIITDRERSRDMRLYWEIWGDTQVKAYNGSSAVPCWIRWCAHRTRRLFRIDMSGPDRDHTAQAADLFDALALIRRELDPAGWQLGVNGARRDTYPSSADRDERGGAVVRVFGPGRDGVDRAPLGTFDEAPADLLATVEDQQRSFDESTGER